MHWNSNKIDNHQQPSFLVYCKGEFGVYINLLLICSLCWCWDHMILLALQLTLLRSDLFKRVPKGNFKHFVIILVLQCLYRLFTARLDALIKTTTNIMLQQGWIIRTKLFIHITYKCILVPMVKFAFADSEPCSSILPLKLSWDYVLV